jgi:hypothetical protein
VSLVKLSDKQVEKLTQKQSSEVISNNKNNKIMLVVSRESECDDKTDQEVTAGLRISTDGKHIACCHLNKIIGIIIYWVSGL